MPLEFCLIYIQNSLDVWVEMYIDCLSIGNLRARGVLALHYTSPDRHAVISFEMSYQDTSNEPV